MARKQKKVQKKSPVKEELSMTGVEKMEVDEVEITKSTDQVLKSTSFVSNHQSDEVQLGEAVRHYVYKTAEQMERIEIQFEPEPNPPTLVVDQNGPAGVNQQIVLVPVSKKMKDIKTNPAISATTVAVPKKPADFKKCAANNCLREAFVKCPSCSEVLYCNTKHMKIHSKEHEPSCVSAHQFTPKPNPPSLELQQKEPEEVNKQIVLVPTSKKTYRSRTITPKPSSSTSLKVIMPFKPAEPVEPLKLKADFQECAVEGCRKEASVKCPSCSTILYCTAKHQKVHVKDHERSCVTYRFLEKPRIGRYIIAAQEIPISGFLIFRDEPIVMFPLTEFEFHEIPKTYCVRCYRKYPKDTVLIRMCKCELPVCSTPNTCEQLSHSPRLINHSLECAALTSNPLIKLRVNSNFITLVRLLMTSQSDPLITELLKKATFLKIPPPPPSFMKKLNIIKNMLPFPTPHSDNNAHALEISIKRYGRNVAPDIGYIHQQPNALARWTKCIYNHASHVLHSCVPNAMFEYAPQGALILRSLKKIQKGETLYVSFDNRLLFTPSYNRYNKLRQDYCYECNCKRCRSINELDTYFSSFPCPQCHPQQKFIVSQETFVSDWKCQQCKLTISAASVERFIARTHHYLSTQKTPYEILRALEELVEEGYVHWKNFLVFHDSVRLLNQLYLLLEQNDMPTIKKYSDSRGLAFKQPANTVINITGTFMPYGYMPAYVLVLRISGIIKIREMIDQVEEEFYNMQQMDKTIWGLYYRTEELTNVPLYAIELPNKIQERNICVLELKVLNTLLKSLFPIYGEKVTTLKSQAPYLIRMFIDKVEKYPNLLAEIDVKKASPLFPFNLLV